MNNVRIFAFPDKADASITKQVAAMVRNGLQGLEFAAADGGTCLNQWMPWMAAAMKQKAADLHPALRRRLKKRAKSCLCC